MSTASPRTVLCRYHYDPLDRLVDCTPLDEAGVQRFYCKSRLATEIQGAVQHSVFQHEDQLLAQLRREDVTVNASLLATDQQRSVLNVLDASKLQSLVYTPYGHRLAENGLLSLLGFNGERPDPVTGHYLLGNGYRAFNPVLMRFNSPDSWSPFGEGGLNAYAYCTGDPRNKEDSTGHAGILSWIAKFIWPKINPIREIAHGAKVQNGWLTLAPRMPNSKATTIQLKNYTDRHITIFSHVLNKRSENIYENLVHPKIYNPRGVPINAEHVTTITNAAELVSNYRILYYQPLSPARAVQVNFLRDSIDFHRNLIEAQNITKHLPIIRELELAHFPPEPQVPVPRSNLIRGL
jgi:RHS repeat-associated protein